MAAVPSARPQQVVMMGGAKDGIFTPLVKFAKRLWPGGQTAFLGFRGKVIAEHTKVIQAFVDTADTPSGQATLKQLFAIADKDGNGVLDKEEIKDALKALGFYYLSDKQIDGIMERADADGDATIDLEECLADAPKTLRVNLVKLAKANGAELG